MAAIRRRLGVAFTGKPMSQEAFAERSGFNPATVRDWEQGRREPDTAACVLLLVIANDPHVVDVALEAAVAANEAGKPVEA